MRTSTRVRVIKCPWCTGRADHGTGAGGAVPVVRGAGGGRTGSVGHAGGAGPAVRGARGWPVGNNASGSGAGPSHGGSKSDQRRWSG